MPTQQLSRAQWQPYFDWVSQNLAGIMPKSRPPALPSEIVDAEGNRQIVKLRQAVPLPAPR